MQLTEAQIKKMQDYLQDQPVKLAYLFGSQATGRTTPLSDVDVGVVFADDLPDSKKFDLRLRLMLDLSQIAQQRDSVEVVPLEKVSILFRHEAIGGVELVNQDEDFTRDFRYETLHNYFANLHYRRLHTDLYLDRVAEEGLS